MALCTTRSLCQKGWPAAHTSHHRHPHTTMVCMRKGRRHLQTCAASQRLPAPTQRTPAAKAAIFTGTYATIAGLALTAAPMTVFGLLFDSSAVPRGWIRVGGILFALIGMQYFGAGFNDSRCLLPNHRSFYEASIWSRLFLVVGFIALVTLKELNQLGLLVLAALNLVGALSMLRALRATDALLAQKW